MAKGSYEGFDKLKASLAQKGVRSPGALAAYIGKKKDGAANFESAAKKGKKIRPGSKGYGQG